MATRRVSQTARVSTAPPHARRVQRADERRAYAVACTPDHAAAGGAALLAAGGLLVTRAGLTLDLGIGRRLRPLGPIRIQIAAPPEVVFDVIAAPYLRKTPRAMRDKLEVIERGTDLVLAAHHTPLHAA